MWLLFDKPNVRKIALCMLYRPPTGDIQYAFDELSASVDYVQPIADTEFVIIGDMNLNYRDRHSKSFYIAKEFERIFILLIS